MKLKKLYIYFIFLKYYIDMMIFILINMILCLKTMKSNEKKNKSVFFLFDGRQEYVEVSDTTYCKAYIDQQIFEKMKNYIESNSYVYKIIDNDSTPKKEFFLKNESESIPLLSDLMFNSLTCLTKHNKTYKKIYLEKNIFDFLFGTELYFYNYIIQKRRNRFKVERYRFVVFDKLDIENNIFDKKLNICLFKVFSIKKDLDKDESNEEYSDKNSYYDDEMNLEEKIITTSKESSLAMYNEEGLFITVEDMSNENMTIYSRIECQKQINEIMDKENDDRDFIVKLYKKTISLFHFIYKSNQIIIKNRIQCNNFELRRREFETFIAGCRDKKKDDTASDCCKIM